MTTEATSAAEIKALLHRMVDDWVDDYPSLREAMESLHQLYRFNAQGLAMQAASTYLWEHCERCGTQLDGDQNHLINDLERLRIGDEELYYATDSEDRLCLTCYRTDLEADGASWLRELHQPVMPRGPELVTDRFPLPPRYDLDAGSPEHATFYSLLYRYDTIQTLPSERDQIASLKTLAEEAETLKTQTSDPTIQAAYAWLSSLCQQTQRTTQQTHTLLI